MADETNNVEDKTGNPASGEKEATKPNVAADDKAWSLEEVNESSDRNLKNASDRLDQIEQELNASLGKEHD